MDASVVAKWVLPVEPHRESAFKLREDQTSGKTKLYAPALLAPEVANTLWKAVRFRRFPEEAARVALEALDDVNVILVEFDWKLTVQAFKIACELDVAVYDASYLYLSQKLKAPLVTADERLCKRAEKRYEVFHIKDY